MYHTITKMDNPPPKKNKKTKQNKKTSSIWLKVLPSIQKCLLLSDFSKLLISTIFTSHLCHLDILKSF